MVTLLGTLSAVAFGVYDRYAGGTAASPSPASTSVVQSTAPAVQSAPSGGVLGAIVDSGAPPPQAVEVSTPQTADLAARPGYSAQAEPPAVVQQAPAAREPSFAVPHAGPSFSCTLPPQRYSRQERAICASPELASADLELGRVYAQARQRGNAQQSARMKTDQREWMRSRDRCVDDACLLALYERRIAILRGTN